jgi:membrane associated rhomboid family serine protease
MYNSEKFKPTYILIAINVIVYIYTSVVGGNFFLTSNPIIYQWGQLGDAIINGGAYYQLLTSMFIHASIVHIAGNMIFLLVFGLRGEEMFSLPEYLTIYFLGGIAGNLLSLLFLPLDVPSVGASGAIFALFGATIIHARRSVGQSVIGAIIFGFFLLFLSSAPDVNNLAHIGGLVFGLILGYVLAARRKRGTQFKTTYSYGNPFSI